MMNNSHLVLPATPPFHRQLTLVVQSPALGGAEIFLGDLAVELARQAWRVKVYTTNRTWASWLKAHQVWAGHLPVVIDITGNWKGLVKAFLLFPWAVLVYLPIVWTNRRSIFLMSGFFEKTMVSLPAQLFGARVAWIEFATLAPVFAKFFGLPKWWYRLARHIPHTIITSSAHSYYLLLQDDLPKQKLTIIPCGRQLTHLLGDQVDRAPADWPAHPHLVCVSRLEPGKGQDILIKALPLINKFIPDLKCLLVGSGDWLPYLQSLAREYQVSDQVIFTGQVESVASVMQSAKLVVCPSVWIMEGFGMNVIEAMALGKAVVAFRTGPYPELITHKQNGWLCGEKTPYALATGIVLLLQDHQLRKRVAVQAKKDFEDKYAIEIIAQKYIQILEGVR